MELVHTSTYDDDLKRLAKLGATDVEIWETENIIAAGPEAGDLIPDSGGLRKVRFGFGGKGKRGGGRTIYYVLTQDSLIFLLPAYGLRQGRPEGPHREGQEDVQGADQGTDR